MREVTTSYFYRAEEGQRGDGRWPPKARDTGRGMRSRVEVYWRPPEGAKRPKGCVCGISPEAEGVRTQSRRHLNAVKVETGRGKGAERPARPKLRIDRGGMGGGGPIDYEASTTFNEWKDLYDDEFLILPNGNPSNRMGIFHYCPMINEITGQWWGKDSSNWDGAGEYNGDQFVIEGDAGGPVVIADFFMHELGHNIIGVESNNPLADHLDTSGHCSDNNCPLQSSPADGTPGYCSNCWNAIDFTCVSWG